MKPFESLVRVRYAETDAMGIVHHSKYFVWLEFARIEWLKSISIDYKEMEKNGIFLPVVEVGLSYKLPAFFDDCIKIIVMPCDDYHNRVRFRFDYELYKKNICISKGFSVHVFIDSQRKPIMPPDNFIKALDKNC